MLFGGSVIMPKQDYASAVGALHPGMNRKPMATDQVSTCLLCGAGQMSATGASRPE
jgi:hypothetical protein